MNETTLTGEQIAEVQAKYPARYAQWRVGIIDDRDMLALLATGDIHRDE